MLSKFGISDLKKAADWVNVRDPSVVKAACTGKPSSEVNYYMLNIYYKKFGSVDNARFAIVSAQMDTGTRKVQTDSVTNTNYFTLPLTIDWIELPATKEVYTPPVPNLSERFYLPDVRANNLERPLSVLRCKGERSPSRDLVGRADFGRLPRVLKVLKV